VLVSVGKPGGGGGRRAAHGEVMACVSARVVFPNPPPNIALKPTGRNRRDVGTLWHIRFGALGQPSYQPSAGGLLQALGLSIKAISP